MSFVRFFTRLPLRLERAVRTWKKDTRMVIYDLRRMKTSTLKKVYTVVTVVAVISTSTGYVLVNTLFIDKVIDKVCLKV